MSSASQEVADRLSAPLQGNEFVDRVQLLFRGSLPVILPGHLIAATALAVGLDVLAGDRRAWIAWCFIMGWAVIRTGHILHARRAPATESDAYRQARVFVVLTAAIALSWGVWGAIAIDPAHPLAVALVVVTISGVVSGGVGSLAPVYPAFAVYGTCAAVPPIVRLIMLGETPYLIISVLATILFFMNLYASYSHHRKIRETIDLRHRIARLAVDLETRATEAERVNAAKTRFLSAASHDLRQPLRAINLYADLLADESPELGESTTLDRIRQATAITEESLDELLDLTQLEAGVVVPHVRRAPLQSVFDRIETLFRPVSNGRQIGLVLRRTSAVLSTDPRLLERMLQNLIGNSLRYTPAGGCVLVAARRRGAAWVIEVRDNGVGIAPDEADRVFDEFRRLKDPVEGASGSRKGLGLGLSIVRRIAELVGHHVEFDSALGRGTTFRLYVAAVADDPVIESDVSREALDGARCLLISHDMPFRNRLVPAMHVRNYRVTVESNPEATLVRVGAAQYEMVIVDDGAVCASSLAQLERLDAESSGKAGVVIVTVDPESKRARQFGGRWPVLSKSMNLQDLLQLLERFRRDEDDDVLASRRERHNTE